MDLRGLLESRTNKGDAKEIVSYPLGNVRSPVKTTYTQLLLIAKGNAKLLRSRADFKDGSVVLLHIQDQLESVIWFWTVLFAGAIPAMSIPLSANSTRRAAHLEHLSQILKNPLCVTDKKDIEHFSNQDATRPILIEDIKRTCGVSKQDFDWQKDASSSDVALLMLTSGSTGSSKAVSLSHAQILSAVKGKSSVVELPDGTSFLNWIGMDHVASLVEIHLQALYMNASQVFIHAVDILVDPLRLVNLISEHRTSRTFAPNFFLAKLRMAIEGMNINPDWDLSCLRYIASGGEANVTDTCARVADLLSQFGASQSAIIPGFGMTETCAGSIFNLGCPTYDIAHGLEYASLGRCMPGISMRVTDGDSALPSGEVGDLEVMGPVVFSEYFNDESATAAAFTADGWFRTGDRALIDMSGHLVLVGRGKDILIVNGVKYNPLDVELAIDGANISGVTPTFTVCFSSLRTGAQTEELWVAYLPAHDPEDHESRLRISAAIIRTVVSLTGARPHVLPLDGVILQKSTLGKLSRTKTKTALEKGELKPYEDAQNEALRLQKLTRHSKPINQRERLMLKIFLNALEVSEEEFDVVTPIFETGITSIELIRLKRNLEEHLELVSEIPMILLMTKPTIRELASALEDQPESTEYEPGVVLRYQGAKQPLWLVHPGVGEVLVFLNLVKYLTDRPVYALRARGFNKGEPYFESIDEMVTSYFRTIKQTQPDGPYALAGYSYGTMVAFEVAKRLEADGCEVGFLGSFNLPPHIKTRMRQLDWAECLLHLSYFLGLMTEIHARQLAKELHARPRGEVLAAVLTHVDGSRMVELALTPLALYNWANLASQLQSLAVDYEPRGSVVHMDVFYCTPLAVVAASREEWLEHHLSKWESFCRETPRFHEVDGEHYTMLGPEHVIGFQDTLRKALLARGL
ncbi:MAG: hypothetical protein Q9160_008963 [Pyrenula sp. 1 TL-2023]